MEGVQKCIVCALTFSSNILSIVLSVKIHQTESIPQKITSRLPGEPKRTAPPRFGGKYPGGLEQVSEGGVRLYSMLPASKEQEGALQIT